MKRGFYKHGVKLDEFEVMQEDTGMYLWIKLLVFANGLDVRGKEWEESGITSKFFMDDLFFFMAVLYFCRISGINNNKNNTFLNAKQTTCRK